MGNCHLEGESYYPRYFLPAPCVGIMVAKILVGILYELTQKRDEPASYWTESVLL